MNTLTKFLIILSLTLLFFGYVNAIHNCYIIIIQIYEIDIAECI